MTKQVQVEVCFIIAQKFQMMQGVQLWQVNFQLIKQSQNPTRTTSDTFKTIKNKIIVAHFDFIYFVILLDIMNYFTRHEINFVKGKTQPGYI